MSFAQPLDIACAAVLRELVSKLSLAVIVYLPQTSYLKSFAWHVCSAVIYRLVDAGSWLWTAKST